MPKLKFLPYNEDSTNNEKRQLEPFALLQMSCSHTISFYKQHVIRAKTELQSVQQR